MPSSTYALTVKVASRVLAVDPDGMPGYVPDVNAGSCRNGSWLILTGVATASVAREARVTAKNFMLTSDNKLIWQYGLAYNNKIARHGSGLRRAFLLPAMNIRRMEQRENKRGRAIFINFEASLTSYCCHYHSLSSSVKRSGSQYTLEYQQAS